MSVRFCKTFGKIQWVAGGKDALRGSTWGDDLGMGKSRNKRMLFLGQSCKYGAVFSFVNWSV